MFRKFKLFSEWRDIPDEDLNYMSSASAAVLQQTPKGGRLLLWLIVLFFVSFIVWAFFANVDEFTRGEGKVIPSQYIQVIQNLEGGILSELNVREGQEVKRGQTLLRIDDKRFVSSLREADVTLSQLQIKATRLRAEANGLPFVVDASIAYDPILLAREMALHESRQSELSSNREVFAQQLKQKKQELSEVKAKRNQLKTSNKLLAR